MVKSVAHEAHGAQAWARRLALRGQSRRSALRGFRLLHRLPAGLPSIVEYRDGAAPRNEYPTRIVSPSRPGACCAAHMVSVGAPQADSRWVFEYRRCERCGFTVRRVVREIFDEAAQVKLRLALAHAFARNMGDPQ